MWADLLDFDDLPDIPDQPLQLPNLRDRLPELPDIGELAQKLPNLRDRLPELPELSDLRARLPELTVLVKPQLGALASLREAYDSHEDASPSRLSRVRSFVRQITGAADGEAAETLAQESPEEASQRDVVQPSTSSKGPAPRREAAKPQDFTTAFPPRRKSSNVPASRKGPNANDLITKETKQGFSECHDVHDADYWMHLGMAGGGVVGDKHVTKSECYQFALDLVPDNAKAWCDLGVEGGGRVGMKDYDSKACYEQALELDAQCTDAWRGLSLQGGVVGGRAYSIEKCNKLSKVFSMGDVTEASASKATGGETENPFELSSIGGEPDSPFFPPGKRDEPSVEASEGPRPRRRRRSIQSGAAGLTEVRTSEQREGTLEPSMMNSRDYHVWEVVGGGSAGGIVVRGGVALDSEKDPERLSIGSSVRELELQGTRMRFWRLTGRGPKTGWVSLSANGADLLVRGRFGIRALLMRAHHKRPIHVKYEFDEKAPIFIGDFRYIYMAKSRASGDERILKKIEKWSPSDRQIRTTTVQAELQALMKLDHPNIMRLFEHFEDHTAMWLVTEVCSGGTFADFFSGTDVDLEDARVLFWDVVSAIAYCHSMGVVHRDLKCENCLIVNGQHRPYAKVIDFGVAAICDSHEVGNWLHELTGTPFYRAPEVLEHDQEYGPKVDMWSIGVMLYVSLSGEHPFHACSFCAPPPGVDERLQMFDEISVEPLCEAYVPGPAQDLIFKLLKKDVGERLSARDALAHGWLLHPASHANVNKVGTNVFGVSSLMDSLREGKLMDKLRDVVVPMCNSEQSLVRSAARSSVGSPSGACSPSHSPERSPARSPSRGLAGRSPSSSPRRVARRTPSSSPRHRPAKLNPSYVDLIGRTDSFRTLALFERAILRLIAHSLQDREVSELQRCFQALDVDNSGTLSKSAIRNAIKASGTNVTDAELDEIFAALDAGGSGKVHYTEWLAAAIEPSTILSDAAVREVFSFFDTDNSGSISREELSAVLGQQFGDDLLRSGDWNPRKNPTLSLEEFHIIVERIAAMR